MKYRIHPIWLYFAAIVLLVALYASRAHSFLSVTIKTKPQVLLVEGWLEENYYEEIAKELSTGQYEKVITTGGSLPNEFRMHTNGGLIYRLNEIGVQTYGNCKTVSLTCYGTEAYGVYPEVNVWADSICIGNFYTRKETAIYTFQIPDSIKNVEKIIVEFTNDACEGWKDRNLYILNLSADGVDLGVRRVGVYFDRGLIDGVDCHSVFAHSYADQALRLLVENGVYKSRIISISSESPNNASNRTLSHALSVKKWKETTKFPLRSINIYTKGTHARRSLMTYRKVFGDDVNIGVIAMPSYNYDPSRWWMSSMGIQSVFYETFALIYYWVVLFFV
jgi:hypothetical protein